MVFNSVKFLIFFPIVTLIYFILPKKFQYIWLLITSYYFYMCWNVKYSLLLLLSTLTTYFCGLFVSKYGKRNKKNIQKLIMSLCIVINLLILFIFKYCNFSIDLINQLFSNFNIQFVIQKIDILLPIGISFYTFQALGYIIDVYRNDIEAEKNIFKYALFVSFFPQLVAGPIERSKNLLPQFNSNKKFNVENCRMGLLVMSYGLFLKVVVADNIAVIINPVFNNFQNYQANVVLLATILFAFQIYCDFHGYTQIAIGSAKILGFDLNENFNAPYLASSVKDFWKRWHISLTKWFTDYLYIPLGGNRKGKIRKYINTMIVFLLSGLWHGAALHYVVWGGINGLYLVIQDSTINLRNKIYSFLKIDIEKIGFKILSCIVTFILVDIAWLFFRAPSLSVALKILKKIVLEVRIHSIFNEKILSIFGNMSNLLLIFMSLLLILRIDFLKIKKIDITKLIFDQQIVFRWFIYFFIVIIILVYGYYGVGYEQTQFIYFQF